MLQDLTNCERVIGTCEGYVPPPDLDQRIKEKECMDVTLLICCL